MAKSRLPKGPRKVNKKIQRFNMKYSQAQLGRVFIIRLEDGDIMDQEIKKIAKVEKVKAATLIAVGGVDKDSCLIVGPEDGRSKKIIPKSIVLDNVHELTATGTLFPDADGEPIVHMHAACGRNNQTITGCIREGVKTWHVLEVIMTELINTDAKRLKDIATGFKLLNP